MKEGYSVVGLLFQHKTHVIGNAHARFRLVHAPEYRVVMIEAKAMATRR
jgi:hypothetical protein